MKQQYWCARVVAVILAVAVVPVPAQTPPQLRPPQRFAAYLHGQYATLKRNITGAAEKMPAEHFSFKPVPEVMSYADLLTHVIETQYFYCSTVRGTTDPAASLNFKVTDKAAVGTLVRDSLPIVTRCLPR